LAHMLLLVALLAALTPKVQLAQRSALRLVQTIPLPGVEGRIDHFSADAKGYKLFVSALGNHTVEVLDLTVSRRVKAIGGLKEPQGVLYVPEANQIFVADGGDGTCRLFDGRSYRLKGTIHFSSDADNVRYDTAAKRVYVGYGEGALGILDAATGKRLGDVPLRGHAESFQLERSGPRIFVNVPTADHSIAVVDRVKRSVIATWFLEARSNFPMALDEADQRLIVVARTPARLIVLDSVSGKAVASVPTVGDADDLFYDTARKRLYVSGGEGFIDTFQQEDPDHYRPLERIKTALGARTSYFLPELNRLYLAVPHRGQQAAEIRVYETQP
jgi:DNA-binding beta-propeller fold protein YncE